MAIRKGISQTIGRLILIVLAVIIVASFLIGTVQGDLGTQISEFFSGILGEYGNGGGGTQLALLEGAIKCVLIRCAEGCTFVKDDNFGPFTDNCITFCRDRGIDKICGTLSKTYPIELTLTTDTKITRDQWIDLVKPFISSGISYSLVPSDDCDTSFGLQIPTTAECTKDGLGRNSECILPAGNYILWGKKDAVTICPSSYGAEKNVLLFDHNKFGTPPDPVPFKYTDDDLSDDGINKIAASVRVPDGWKVTLYEGKDKGGKYMTVIADSSSLGLGDSASSIEILGGSECYAILYEDTNFRGDSVTIHDSESNLQDVNGPCFGHWVLSCADCPCECSWLWCSKCANDCISSIKVEGGENCRAVLYEHPDYNTNQDGSSVTVSGWSSSLHFNDKAQSIEIDLPVYDIKVVVSEGGKVDVSRNDGLVESITGPSEATIQFTANDKAKFEPEASSGYVFETWCGEKQEVCCSPQLDDYCTETIERLINADGEIYANFASS